MNLSHILIWPVFLTIALTPMAVSDVLETNNQAQWEAAAGDFTTITFTEFPPPALLTTQYAYLGIIFTEGNDGLYPTSSFVNDGWGVYGNHATITVAFDTPQGWIGVDHPGFASFKLYSNGQLFYDTGTMSGGGEGLFSGVVSDQLFDSVVIYSPFGGIFIDDLHFGGPIPAPGALALLGIASVFVRSRRRGVV